MDERTALSRVTRASRAVDLVLACYAIALFVARPTSGEHFLWFAAGLGLGASVTFWWVLVQLRKEVAR